MYTTKSISPKKSDLGYLSIGDPYDKVEKHRIDKEELLNVANWKRHTGEQFHVVGPKKGQTAGYFSTFQYAPDSYQEHVPYLEREPPAERPSGFGTRDARRRDEFTNQIRAQQHKETIQKEHKRGSTDYKLHSNDVYLTTAQQVAAHHREKSEQLNGSACGGQSAGAAPASLPSTSRSVGGADRDVKTPGEAWYAPDRKAAADNKAANNVFQSNAALPPIAYFQNSVRKHTYDITKAAQTAKSCHKCSRDTFYCKHRAAGTTSNDGSAKSSTGGATPGAQSARYVGHYRTTQMAIGHGHQQSNALKPQHGRKGTLHTFRDFTHLSTTFS